MTQKRLLLIQRLANSHLVVKRITATNCNLPIIDRGPIVTILQIVVTIIQDIFFIIRIASRILKLAPWGPDDTTIVIAWVRTPFTRVVLSYSIPSTNCAVGIAKCVSRWRYHW